MKTIQQTKSNHKGVLALIICAFIWGTTFVFQSTGMDHVEPLTFNAMRNILSAIFLAGLWLVMRIPRGLSVVPPQGARKIALVGGLVCGACLGLGMGLQQTGLAQTTVGKTGFISTLYIILVPLIRMAAGKKYGKTIWLCVLMALVGLFLLTVSGDAIIRRGDVIVFVSAIVFTVHILVINYYSGMVEGVLLSFLQMVVAALISLIGMAWLESPTAAGIIGAGTSVLYAGVMSGGVAFTLQIVAQKHVEPTVASLIMCFEAVFAAFAGWLVLHERLSVREWIGAALMFVAMIIVQRVTNRTAGEASL